MSSCNGTVGVGDAQRRDGRYDDDGGVQEDALRQPAGPSSAPRSSRSAPVLRTLRTLVVVLVGLLALLVSPAEAQAQATLDLTLGNDGSVTGLGSSGGQESIFVDFNLPNPSDYSISMSSGTINVNNVSGGVLTDGLCLPAPCVTISGNVTSLSFAQDDDQNIYTIRSIGDPLTISNSALTANGDTINIGSGSGGTMDGIGANVTISYTGNSDAFVTLNDGGDPDSDPAVTISATQVTGMAPGAINLPDGLGGLILHGGTGGNTYTVANTPSVPFTFNLGNGAGTDTATIQNVSMALTVRGQAGANVVNLGDATNPVSALTADVTVTAVGGTTSLAVNDAADMTARTLSITSTDVTMAVPARVFDFSAANLTSLAVSGGSGGNSITVVSTVSGSTTTVNTGTGVDDVDVVATGGSLSVNGQSGADTVALGSTGSTQALNGTIAVTNPGGSTVLSVTNSSDPAAKAVTIGAGSLTGTLVNTATVTYANLASLEVNGGGGGNTFTVNDTPAVATTLNTGSGTDSVSVVDTGGALAVNVQDGANNTVTLGATNLNVSTFGGTVTVTTTAPGTTGLFILSSNDTTGRALNISGTQTTVTPPGLLFDYTGATLTGLTVAGGSGGNTITVPNTRAGITTVVDSGPSPANADTVTVHAVTAGSTLNVNGQAGADSVTLGNAGSAQNLSGTINVSNASGATALTVDNSADGTSRAVTIGAASLTGTLVNGATVTYANLSALTVSAGGGGNPFTVTSTPAAPTTLNLGGGNDTLDVADTGQTLTVNGQGGTNTVTLGATDNTITDFDGNVTLTTSGGGTTVLGIMNTADPTGRTFTVTGTETTLVSPARMVTYGGAAVSTLTLTVGTGGDLVNVTPSATIPITLTDTIAGAPNDTVNVNSVGLSNRTFTGTPASGTFTATGVQTVTYTNFEVRQENGASAGGTLDLSAATYTVAEAAGTATITVNRTGTTLGSIDVTVTPANGTATSPGDFDPTPRTITFAEGVTTASALIPIVNDTLDESDETVAITLSNPTNGAVLGTQTTATLTIVDDDGTPSVSVASNQAAESAGTLTLGVTLGAPSGQTVTVQYATGSGTATAGASCAAGVDYVSASGTLTFTPGTTSQPIPVTVCADAADEPDETFAVTLSNPTNASLGTATATATITDDDGSASLSVAGASQVEGNGGTSTLTFTVTLGPASGQPVTVQFATGGGTATAGASCGGAVDYQTTNGSLTFNPGETTRPVSVTTCGDTLDEPNETFILTLANPTNTTIGMGTATGTIQDDDEGGGGGAPVVSVANAQQAEGSSGPSTLTFSVTLSAASPQTVTVQYATRDGTAAAGPACAAGVDYVSASGTLSFSPGTTSLPIPVTICGDTVTEPNETLTLTLSNPTNATIGTGAATGTILDDEGGGGGAPVVSVANAQQAEGSSGPSTLTFTVTLNTVSSQAVTVQYSTGGGTATAGASCGGTVDYQTTNGSLTFNPGETAKGLPVTICGDTSDEPNETFILTLSNPVNATIGTGAATGTILDDDGVARVGLGQSQVTRNEEGTGTLTVQILLSDATGPASVGGPGPGRSGDVSAASGVTVTVNFTTADGTARANVDYVPTSGTVIFDPGDTVKTISVPLLSSAFTTNNLTIQILLTGATNASVDPARSQVTIQIPNLPIPPRPEVKPPVDDTDKPQRLTEAEQNQRDHTSALGPDDLHTEGNVVEAACDADPPTVTIVNRDGRVTVLLVNEARERCGEVKVGDYLQVSGRKQNEQLFEADEIDVSRAR